MQSPWIASAQDAQDMQDTQPAPAHTGAKVFLLLFVLSAIVVGAVFIYRSASGESGDAEQTTDASGDPADQTTTTDPGQAGGGTGAPTAAPPQSSDAPTTASSPPDEKGAEFRWDILAAIVVPFMLIAAHFLYSPWGPGYGWNKKTNPARPASTNSGVSEKHNNSGLFGSGLFGSSNTDGAEDAGGVDSDKFKPEPPAGPPVATGPPVSSGGNGDRNSIFSRASSEFSKIVGSLVGGSRDSSLDLPKVGPSGEAPILSMFKPGSNQRDELRVVEDENEMAKEAREEARENLKKAADNVVKSDEKIEKLKNAIQRMKDEKTGLNRSKSSKTTRQESKVQQLNRTIIDNERELKRLQKEHGNYMNEYTTKLTAYNSASKIYLSMAYHRDLFYSENEVKDKVNTIKRSRDELKVNGNEPSDLTDDKKVSVTDFAANLDFAKLYNSLDEEHKAVDIFSSWESSSEESLDKSTEFLENVIDNGWAAERSEKEQFEAFMQLLKKMGMIYTTTETNFKNYRAYREAMTALLKQIKENGNALKLENKSLLELALEARINQMDAEYFGVNNTNVVIRSLKQMSTGLIVPMTLSHYDNVSTKTTYLKDRNYENKENTISKIKNLITAAKKEANNANKNGLDSLLKVIDGAPGIPETEANDAISESLVLGRTAILKVMESAVFDKSLDLNPEIVYALQYAVLNAMTQEDVNDIGGGGELRKGINNLMQKYTVPLVFKERSLFINNVITNNLDKGKDLNAAKEQINLIMRDMTAPEIKNRRQSDRGKGAIFQAKRDFKEHAAVYIAALSGLLNHNKNYNKEQAEKWRDNLGKGLNGDNLHNRPNIDNKWYSATEQAMRNNIINIMIRGQTHVLKSF
jgi:hypothetical protein